MSANNTTGELTAAAAKVQPIAAQNSGQWTTGLFDCFDDSDNSAGEAARNYYLLGSFGCAFCYSYPYRTQLREVFSLEEQPCADCLVHCFCIQCALCQEHRQHKKTWL
ncbi:protein PLANT CADMIUM RESISTANCE 9-like [Hibiscus syriacus]|uniref:protein PLANT CADMIUM RESISTANCE 9-like n=1 Tax=Hibiscus syriacus TaxID=106335 RepID=UPI001923BBB0|nr:protein PLANT CADMIUM RESISTANCE 9-like [Hibiscus syriacus]